MKTCKGCGETRLSEFGKDKSRSDGLSSRCRTCKNQSSKDWRKRQPEWGAWHNMIQRCHNPRHKKYAQWGGRGIKVCDRWRSSFENFLEDMGPRPGSAYNYSIDRVDNDAGYSPNNCRWATTKQQNYNKTTTFKVMFEGKEYCLADLCGRLFPGKKEALKARKAIHQYISRDGFDIREAISKHSGRYPEHFAGYEAIDDA